MGTFSNPTKTSVIAVSGSSGTAIELEGWELACLEVPTLDSSTLVIYGSVDGGTTYRVIKDGLGNQLMNFAAGTGNFIVAARDMVDLVGCTHIKPVCGSAQNTAARTLTLYGRPRSSGG